MRIWNDVRGKDLADLGGGGGSRFDSGLARGNIASAEDRYDSSIDFFSAHNFNFCGFDHRISSLNERNDSVCFDHAKSFHAETLQDNGDG